VTGVARKVRDQALAGDVAAGKVLLSYVVGKPAPAADPDRLDLDELQLLLERPFAVQLLLHAIEGVEPAAAVAFRRDIAAAKEGQVLKHAEDKEKLRLLATLRDKAVEARARET
jgi:hypothetical protein